MTRYRIPEMVAHEVVEGPHGTDLIVYVMVLPDGPPLALRDMGAWIWLLASEGREDITAEIAEATGSSAEAIGTTVMSFVTTLVDRGLLESRP